MKIIHQNGYTIDELAMYRLTIYKNLVDCGKDLVNAMEKFNIEPDASINREFVQFIQDYRVDPDPNIPVDPRLGTAIVSLWKDPCISRVMEHQVKFYLMDSAP